MGESGAQQMDSSTVSPGGLVTAALQRDVSMLGDKPKEALVPYCSIGWGPAKNSMETLRLSKYGKQPSDLGKIFWVWGM